VARSLCLRYHLEALHPGGQSHDLSPGVYRLGRDADCEILVDAAGVSRMHVELCVCESGGIRVRDLGSTNGTRIDGERIVEVAFAGDAVLTLGEAAFRLCERPRGLDGLALALPEPVSPGTEVNLPVVSTLAHGELLARLRRGFARVAKDPGDPRRLGALLAEWRAELSLRGLTLFRNADAAVLACAGEWEESAAITLAENACYRVCGSRVEAAVLRALAEAAAELLRWLPSAGDTGVEPAAPESAGWPGLISASPAMRRLCAELGLAAAESIPILIEGESGVGKELLAQGIHQRSPRREQTLLAINCAALPRDLLEAELFGVERGAATGVDARPGLFERADGGTLFLDELGDMAAETQVRLLRVLEDGRILRLGGRKPLTVDVRIVAATHRHLAAEVEAGRFRLDLYHRLAGFEVRIPALRERPEDIAPLAQHFFVEALARRQRHSRGMTSAALLALRRWPWPGNVRELRQVIERAVILMHPGEALDRRHLPPALQGTPPDPADLRLEAAIGRAERDAVETALALTGGQHEASWTLLGIGRTRFYGLLKTHRLGRETQARDADPQSQPDSPR
jgi:DNA-binding NtrC family response regulator